MFKRSPKCVMCGSRKCEAAKGWEHYFPAKAAETKRLVNAALGIFPMPRITYFTIPTADNANQNDAQLARDMSAEMPPKSTDTVDEILARMRANIDEAVADSMSEVDTFLLGLSEKMTALVETSPFEPTDRFDDFTEEWEYAIVGTPIFFSATDDREMHIAKALYQGDPYTIIAHVDLDPDAEPEVYEHTHYVHIPDNFGFDVYESIVGTTIDNMAADELRKSVESAGRVNPMVEAVA